MAFAREKLYKGYLLRNMSTIVSTVKVREIVPHLPCLTDHDRENIEAKRETNGNFDGMVLLLDCLKRRENWPEEFITALEECNHPTMAAEIRREYEALKGNSTRGSPSTAVTMVHVHPAPPASRMSVPEISGSGESTVPQPAGAPPPPRASPPPQVPRRPQPPETPAVPGSPPPGPVSQPQRSAQVEEEVPLPSTPPPSPVSQHARRASISTPPNTEVNSGQEPVEDSDTDDVAITPDPLSTAGAPQPPTLVEQPGTGTPPPAEDLRASAGVRPPPSRPAAEANPGATYGPAFSVVTPEKRPVQDSNPSILQRERSPGPTCTQGVDSSLQTGVAAPLPVATVTEDPESEDATCLSLPAELVSVQPQRRGGPTLPAPSSPVEPYSGNTTRLEMSSAGDSWARAPACSASTTASTSSMLPCQEKGVVVNHNQPEENHYESPSESLDAQEVRENTLQISEEPSILDLDGHDPTPQGQALNGEAANETTSAAAETLSSPPESGNYQPPPEPAPPPALQHSEKKTSSQLLTSNTKYFVTAAGVGACALLLAWKLKN